MSITYTDLPIKGVTFDAVTATNDTMTFHHSDGRKFVFYHDQDCCESVTIADIVGGLSDLVGHPLEVAEEAWHTGPAEDDDGTWEPESQTWTYYRFRTVIGSVSVRWQGTSNGYYSESVDYGWEE